MDFALINWVAVGVGTIAAFVLGWIIYSPGVFGRRWAEGSGVEINADSKPPAMAMILQLLGLFLLALVIGVTETSNALAAAIIAILAAAFMTVANGAFCKKSGYALGVDGGYVIGAGVVMILAQGLL